MHRMKTFFKSISPFEYALWGCSVLALLLSFFLCGSKSPLNLVGSLLGVTSLIFIAKGNVIGQFLIVAFSVFYGIVSYFNAYYGEMITYLGMSAPAAIVAIITWLRHPFQGKKSEVKINRIPLWEYGVAVLLSGAVTVAFYFILRALDTANLIWSTVSVFTSFFASYLLIRRSPFYAIAYSANDIVLIVLWSLVSVTDLSNVCMAVCFAAFLFNDIYGFISWSRREKRQGQTEDTSLPS
ncbi:MAG: nicotinamide riboside transporter PnuC [Clostridia bacterium]|nr:nicotinamide riboside transporter PnuC [Clostridia bacterium]